MDPWNAGVNNEKIIRRLYMYEMALDTQCIKRGSQLIPTHDDPPPPSLDLPLCKYGYYGLVCTCANKGKGNMKQPKR